MSANSGVLKARQPIQVPVWLVIAVAVALAGALAIATISERETVSRAPAGGAAGEFVAPAQSTVAEFAAIKAQVAQQYWARQHAIGEPVGAQSDAAEMAGLKSAVAQQFLARTDDVEIGSAPASTLRDDAARKTATAREYWRSMHS